LQRDGHNIYDELVFGNHRGYIFHDSGGFEAGGEDELKTVQEFVRSKSREKQLKRRLHAIWFVPFDIHGCNFTMLIIQVLYSDGQ
jgi:hypothetical protein